MCRVGSVAQGVCRGQWKSLVSHCVCVPVRVFSGMAVDKQQRNMVLILLLARLQPAMLRFESTRDSGWTHVNEHRIFTHRDFRLRHCTLHFFLIYFFTQSILLAFRVRLLWIQWLYATLIYLWLPYTWTLTFQLITVCKVHSQSQPMLVSLRKQLRQDSQPGSHHNQHSWARLQNPQIHGTEHSLTTAVLSWLV